VTRLFQGPTRSPTSDCIDLKRRQQSGATTKRLSRISVNHVYMSVFEFGRGTARYRRWQIVLLLCCVRTLRPPICAVVGGFRCGCGRLVCYFQFEWLRAVAPFNPSRLSVSSLCGPEMRVYVFERTRP